MRQLRERFDDSDDELESEVDMRPRKAIAVPKPTARIALENPDLDHRPETRSELDHSEEAKPPNPATREGLYHPCDDEKATQDEQKGDCSGQEDGEDDAFFDCAVPDTDAQSPAFSARLSGITALPRSPHRRTLSRARTRTGSNDSYLSFPKLSGASPDTLTFTTAPCTPDFTPLSGLGTPTPARAFALDSRSEGTQSSEPDLDGPAFAAAAEPDVALRSVRVFTADSDVAPPREPQAGVVPDFADPSDPFGLNDQCTAAGGVTGLEQEARAGPTHRPIASAAGFAHLFAADDAWRPAQLRGDTVAAGLNENGEISAPCSSGVSQGDGDSAGVGDDTVGEPRAARRRRRKAQAAEVPSPAADPDDGSPPECIDI